MIARIQGWHEKHQQIIYTSLIFLVCYVLLALIALRPYVAYDGYWHLQMGKDLVVNGLSPWVDHYSFTYPGQEISSIPVLFQVVLYLFVAAFSESTGFYLLLLAYTLFIMLFIYLYFRQIKASWTVILFILPFITYFIHIRLLIRPEIISNILIILSLLLYLRARDSFSTRELVYISLLLLFWVNYHSPVLGYVIIFGLFLDRAINKVINNDNSYSWRQWFFWGLLIFLIGFANPQGRHFIVHTLSTLGEEFWANTQEYQSSLDFYSKNTVIYISWILSFYVVVWSLLKKQYGFVFISLFLAYYSVTTARLVSSASIINFCILALYLSQDSINDRLSALKPSIRKSLLAACVLICITVFYYIIDEARTSIKARQYKDESVTSRYPVQIVDYLGQYHDGGRILNYMSIGGYLINRLSPDYKVYIDGRTNILYPAEFVKHSMDVFIDPDSLEKEINNRDIEFAVDRNTPERMFAYARINDLSLNFADESFLLFSVKKDVAFPLASTLLVMPMCWNDHYINEINDEILLSKSVLKSNSYTLSHVFNFIEGYINQDDRRQFLKELDPASMPSDSTRRLAAYIALIKQDNKTALKLFKGIVLKNDYDLLMISNTLLNEEDYTNAEGILYYIYTNNELINSQAMSPDKVAIFTGLLSSINEKAGLQAFSPSYISALEDELRKSSYNNGAPLESLIPFHGYCHILF